MGAAVYFTGIVRGGSKDGARPFARSNTNLFQRMAEHQFNLLFDEMEKRWPVESVWLAHRLGRRSSASLSLWVEIVAPIAGEAFCGVPMADR